uniref:Uncharacterized protein n=1 Tax=Rhipicephalus pulchellus TaxID=72859 RepID=L7LV68_RHIPC
MGFGITRFYHHHQAILRLVALVLHATATISTTWRTSRRPRFYAMLRPRKQHSVAFKRNVISAAETIGNCAAERPFDVNAFVVRGNRSKRFLCAAPPEKVSRDQKMEHFPTFSGNRQPSVESNKELLGLRSILVVHAFRCRLSEETAAPLPHQAYRHSLILEG